MIVLEAAHLHVYVKDRLLLKQENLKIAANDRIGLVGRNGSGKTTLLEILAGERSPDQGKVSDWTDMQLLPQLKKTDPTKSGGEVTKEYINQALRKKTGLLFTDEPTTNLDAKHIEWLEKKLNKWNGALVVVSHDRVFLDALCTTIWEIDNSTINIYQGNYSAYLKQKEIERNQQEMAFEKYEKKKRQLEEALVLKEQKASRAGKASKKVIASEAKITGAKPYYAKKQKKLYQAGKAMETRLEKLEKVEKPKETAPIKMVLPAQESFAGRAVVRAENINGKAGNRTLWKPASFEIYGGDKLAVLGTNGCGKTTLLKKVVAAEAGIFVSPSVKIGYFSQNLSILDSDKSILENVSTTSLQTETLIRTVLARLHFFRDDVYKPVHVLSGGERVKTAIAKLFVSDINTLILDEPTNFLDLDTLEALESLLQDYEGTVIFASHDRRFIENLATKLLIFKKQEIQIFDGTYQEYKNYKPQSERGTKEDELLILETKITDILGKLSLDPSPALEEEFQKLLAEKQKLSLIE